MSKTKNNIQPLRPKLELGELFRNILEYLFVIIIALDTNTIWLSMEGSSLDKFLNIALIFVVALYFLANNGTGSAKTFHSIIIALVIGAAYWLIYAALVGINVNSFMYLVIDTFTIYAFILIAKDRHRGSGVLLKYRNLVLIVAAISLFFWTFGSQLGLIQPTGTVYSSWGAQNYASGYTPVPSYYGVYFEHQSLSGGVFGGSAEVIRNTAVFGEAPMCNFQMCIALIIELFYCPKFSKVRTAVFVATILSTFSTTGYCVGIIALTVKYVFSKNATEVTTVLKIIILPTLFIIAIILLQSLVSAKLGTSSGEDRSRDFLTGFEAWAHSPLFGYGYGGSLYYNSVHYGFSNSITPILGYGGLFLAIPYLVCFYNWIVTCVKEKDLQKFLLFASFLMLFAITIVSFRFLTIFLLFAYHFPREGADTVERVEEDQMQASNQRSLKRPRGSK